MDLYTQFIVAETAEKSRPTHVHHASLQGCIWDEGIDSLQNLSLQDLLGEEGLCSIHMLGLEVYLEDIWGRPWLCPAGDLFPSHLWHPVDSAAGPSCSSTHPHPRPHPSWHWPGMPDLCVKLIVRVIRAYQIDGKVWGTKSCWKEGK